MTIFTTPQQPGLGELFGQGFSQGLQMSLPQMIQEMAQKRKMQEFGEMIQKVQQQNLLGQMMPQGAEATGTPGQPLQGMMGQPGAQGGQDPYSMIASNPLLLAKAGELGFADVITKASEAGARQQKLAFEKEKFAKKFALEKRKQEVKEGVIPEAKKQEYSDLADQVGKLAKETNYFKRITPFSEEGAELNSLGEQMFAAIRDKVVKGNMSVPVFNYIRNAVTVRARDTNAQIQGKLNAFRRYAQLLEKGKDYSNFSIKDAKKLSGFRAQGGEQQPKALNKDMAQQFLNTAKGDKAKAREMAKEAGYTF